MKKPLILIALLTSWWKLQAQQRDTVPEVFQSDKTEIQALYSYYTQDGSHSAVTGGTGTEELRVQGITLKGSHHSEKPHFFSWQAGIDFITSASTDRIDAVLSSASLVDRRAYAALNAGIIDHHKREWQIGTGLSIESDYLSVPFRAKLNLPRRKNRQWSFGTEVAFDDLRWGRLNPDYYAPVRLIFPEELRGKVQLQEYKRVSGTVTSQLVADIHQRCQLSLQISLTRQEGLLSTPFHRIYFTDGSLSIERLPAYRNKAGISGTLRQFVGNRHIFRTTAGGYTDSWGIHAVSLEEDYLFKFKPGVYAGPFARGYVQTAATWFGERGTHRTENSFYTSDFDLSAFTSIHVGGSLHVYPAGKIGRKIPLQRCTVRGGYYHRSDGLHAVSASLLLVLK